MNRNYILALLSTLAIGLSPVVANAEVLSAPTTISRTAPSTDKPTVVVNTDITEAEVLAAEKAWGDALVAIATTYDRKGAAAAKSLAEQVIDQAYGYQLGTVLFKPTMASAPQTFRTTRAGAVSYFVGGDPAYPHDKGFALKGWRQVEIQNAAIFIHGDTATTMGNVVFTDKMGKVTTVDKTWEFLKDSQGKLRIVLHHSSLPFSPTQAH